ncbi:MAG: cupin domain-containing protein [Proteobacteria bacterium]|nr:cupin domain-containing protein [Pseudomonadota bacterium]
MKPIFKTAFLFGVFSLLSSAVNAEEAQAMPSRQTLLKKEVTLPSSTQMQTNVIRVEFPPGFKTPSHTHEGQGPRYVVKGHLKVEDSGKSQVYGPGDVFWESGQPMTVENVGGADAEFVIFEISPVPAK